MNKALHQTVSSEVIPGVGFFRPALQSADSMELDPRELLGKLWRRKGFIIATMTVLMTLVGIILYLLTPLYTAQPLIMVGSGLPGLVEVVELESGRAGVSADDQTIESEIEVIRSRKIANQVVDQLDLQANPEFNTSLRPTGLLAALSNRVNNLLGPWMPGFLKKVPEENLPKEDLLARKRESVIDLFLSRLTVSQKGDSRVVAVNFTSENPKTAALIANTIAEIYILDQRQTKFEATQRTNAWLDNRIVSLQKQVEASDKAVARYRRESGLLEGQGTTLVKQQLAELNRQLLLANVARTEVEARLRQAEQLVKSPGGMKLGGQVMNSEVIQRLRTEQVEAQRKAADLARLYHDDHPVVLELLGTIHDLKDVIKREVKTVLQTLENDLQVARAREALLQKNFDGMKEQVAEGENKEVGLRALEREADASRMLLTSFLSRFKESSSRDDIDSQQADARIISSAAVPNEPSFPRKMQFLTWSFVISLFSGLLLALLVEMLDHGFRSSDQIEQVTGMPGLGLIPSLGSTMKKGNSAPTHYILEHRSSAFAEAINSLYASIRFSHIDEPPKIIQITSAEAKEGKTTIAICLARMRALSGQKVILVDADIRRPCIHVSLGISSQPGLVDLIAGEISLEAAVQIDELSGVEVIPAGTLAMNPPDILASERMDALLRTLREVYDLVILDTPPVMAVADARILCSKMDRTVFVVRWARTRREAVTFGLKQIETAGGHVAGVLLSMVDVKKHALYDYSDSGHYAGLLKRYYTG